MSDNNDLDVSYGFVETEKEVTEEALSKAPYVNNKDKAAEYKYSGYLMIVFGTIGILFIALTLFGLIPQYFGNPYLSYGVLFAVLVLFWVMGVFSVKSAGGFEKKAKSDNLLEARILDYVKEEITSESLDEACGIEDGDTPEIMYFKRTEHLKGVIGKKFINIDPDFLDDLIDDKIYDSLYEENRE